MARHGVDLLLFAGGDGTARDILDAIGDTTTSLGIPAGVKIHSAVFGATPREAGRAALAFLRDGLGATRMAEVMDIDEDAARQGVAAARLYGYLQVPDDTARLQAAKDGGVESGDRAVKALAAAVAAKMEPGVTYVMGPGSTIAAVMDELGLDGTLLGVDVVRDRQVVASDAGERQVLDLIEGRDARIVVTVIGGQGHILGRGNQQISPQVVRAAPATPATSSSPPPRTSSPQSSEAARASCEQEPSTPATQPSTPTSPATPGSSPAPASTPCSGLPASSEIVIPAKSPAPRSSYRRKPVSRRVEDMKQPCVYILASETQRHSIRRGDLHLVKRVWEHKNDLVGGFRLEYISTRATRPIARMTSRLLDGGRFLLAGIRLLDGSWWSAAGDGSCSQESGSGPE